jgi:hypothetical protein
LTVNDERDSSGSPVFEELFLPPPQRISVAPPPIVVVDFIISLGFLIPTFQAAQ